MSLNPTPRQFAATALAAAAAASPVAQAAAPVAVMDTQNHVLLGFNGIEINNSAFDVRFVDGSCVALFDGCSTNANSFMFTSLAGAHAASQALGNAMAQGGVLGTPNGVGATLPAGTVLTPYSAFTVRGAVATLNFAAASGLDFSSTTNTNAFLQGPFSVQSPRSTSMLSNENTTTDVWNTYARWSVASAVTPVPEPGSLGMMAVGLGAVFLAQGKVRRRRPA